MAGAPGIGWLVWRPPHQFEKWCGRGMVSPHQFWGALTLIFQNFHLHSSPPPRREKLLTFQEQKTLFVLDLQESLTNLNSLPHQFEIASGAADCVTAQI